MVVARLESFSAFDEALARLASIEGGYVDDPLDPGGETNMGITKRVARAFGYTGAMRDLTRAQAADIYRARYWTTQSLDLVAVISRRTALELFDTAVNMGTAVAGTFLQRALNVFNAQGAHYPDVTVDGAVGRLTVAALREFIMRRGPEGERVLLAALNALQGARYVEIAEGAPTSERFAFGWFRARVVAESAA